MICVIKQDSQYCQKDVTNVMRIPDYSTYYYVDFKTKATFGFLVKNYKDCLLIFLEKSQKKSVCSFLMFW